jgi:hypothetical protein
MGQSPRERDGSTGVTALDIVNAARRALLGPTNDEELELRETLLAMAREGSAAADTAPRQSETQAELEETWFGVVLAGEIPIGDDSSHVSAVSTLLTTSGAVVVSLQFDRIVAVLPIQSGSQPHAMPADVAIGHSYSCAASLLSSGALTGAGLALGLIERIDSIHPSMKTNIPSAQLRACQYTDGASLRAAVKGARLSTSRGGEAGTKLVAVSSAAMKVMQAVGVVAAAETTETFTLVEHFDPQGDREDTLP